MSADRASGAFFFFLGLVLYFVVNPAFIEIEEGNSLAPDTLPNLVSVLIAVCGALLMLRPTKHQVQDARFFLRAGLFVVILGVAVYAISHFGFFVVGPILALVMMLVIGERRWLVLVAGTVGVPAFIWFFVTVLLDRSLS